MKSNADTVSTKRERLARILAERKNSESTGREIPRVQRDKNRYLASFAQRRLWFIDYFGGGSAQYNMPEALHVSGEFDLSASEKALSRIIQRHAVLRTVFEADREGVWQVVMEPAPFVIAEIDLTNSSREDALKVIDKAVDDESRHTFNLSLDLMIKASFFRIARQEGVLLINMHHIAADGWSMNILIQEFTRQYDAIIGNRPDPYEPLPIQYIDYTEWQRSRLVENDLDRQLDYWKEKLANLPEVHSLPLNYRRTSKPSGATGIYRFDLDRNSTEAIKAIAVSCNATLFMVLHAALCVLLARHSGSSDIVVGTPVANRLSKAVENLVGLFVNTLVLRIDCSGNPSFTRLVEQARKANIEAQANQEIPFEAIVDAIAPDRDATYSPLFQILFSMDTNKYNKELLVSPHMILSQYKPAKLDSKFELSIAASEKEGALGYEIIYRKDLFSDVTITQLARRFEVMLRAIAGDPEEGIRDLPLLTSDEQRWMDGVLKGSVKAGPPSMETISGLVEKQARERPEATALTFNGNNTTYAELNSAANRLAGYLRTQGVKEGVLVGICLEKSLELIIATLAVLKASGAYVPLDPSYPNERLEFMVRDSGMRTVVTERKHLDKISTEGIFVNTILMDEVGRGSVLRSFPDTDLLLEEAHGAGSCAYVIYTSGSTGRPKGVVVEHNQVIRLFDSCRHLYRFSHDDVWTFYHSFSFDFSVWEIWGALTHGARLVIVPGFIARSVDDFYQLLAREQVTVLNQTPTAFKQLAAADRDQRRALNLRIVIFGGEALNIGELKHWIDRHGDEKPQLFNMYGITETTVHVTYKRITAEAAGDGSGSLIGNPLDDLTLHILDAAGGAVPPNSIGELHVGGAGLSRGYLNSPGLTAERFTTNRLDTGERLYKSGDLAKINSFGELEYIGRIDKQIKMRGFRIELEEIEKTAVKFPGVTGCLCSVAKASGDRSVLLLYYTTAVSEAEDAEPNSGNFQERLQSHIKSRLPGYMCPHILIKLTEFPLNQNGKIDESRLPAPSQDQEIHRSYVEPENETEYVICDVWKQALALARVGSEDNFFNMGGDSILSISVVAALRERSLNVTVQDIFQYQTPRLLANHLHHGPGKNGLQLNAGRSVLLPEESVASEDNGDYEAIYPMSSLQLGMVIHTQLSGYTGIYHDIMSERLRVAWHQQHFEHALDACIARHPILRTNFRLDTEGGVQLVHFRVPTPLEVIDLTGKQDDEQQFLIREWVQERKCHYFDWENDRLFRVTVFIRGENDIEFVTSFHHSVLDGWSRAVLVSELYRYYGDLVSGKSLLPITPDWTFKEFVQLEREVAADESAADYFRGIAEHIEEAQLAVSGVDTEAGESSGWHQFVFDELAPLSGRLIDTAKQLGVPVQSVLLLGHLKVLSIINGLGSSYSCIVVHGRPEKADAERSLGLYLNTLPIAIRFSRKSWEELIRETAQSVTDLMKYRQYPISEIQNLCKRKFSDVLFNYTHFHALREVSREAGINVDVVDTFGFEQTNFDLQVHFSRGVKDDSITLTVFYNADRLPKFHVERFARYYLNVYKSICLDPRELHSVHDYLDPAERKILESFNETKADFSEDTVVRLFENCAKRRPDAIAVRFQDEAMTYRQLDAKSTEMAGILIRNGAGCGQIIGIMADRSLEMIIAVLGVVKAGCAYLPIEPDLPRARINYILVDSGVRILLTHCAMDFESSVLNNGISLLEIGMIWKSDEAERHGPVALPIVSPDSLAYVIYTSGSTGNPKGVMIEHLALTNRLDWMQNQYELRVDDIVLQKTPFTFDVSVWEIFWPLVVGAEMVLAKPEGHKDPGYIIELIQKRRITTIHFVPSMFRSVLDEESWEQCKTLRRIICSGEALPRDIPAIHYKMLSAPIYNLYGPTEAAIDVTSWECPMHNSTERIAIGKPIQNIRLYVLNGDMQRVPLGTPGELYIGGVGLARGYINRPLLTETRFVNHRECDDFGRIYRTGDLVRYMPDGNLEFLSRTDDQIKIRGHRVELGEIESGIQGLAGVKEARVTAVSRNGDVRLTAHIIPETEIEGDASDFLTNIRNELKLIIPEYMVPVAFSLHREWPMTPSGKVDKRKLSNSEVFSSEARLVKPSNKTEEKLTKLCAALLDCEAVAVSTEADFFEVGGHSLLALKYVAEIEKTFHLGKNALKLDDIFEYPTIKELAKLVDSALLNERIALNRSRSSDMSFEEGVI